MDFAIEYPPSDKLPLNAAQSSIEASEQVNGGFGRTTEPDFFVSTLPERLRSNEAFLRRDSGNLGQRREEAERLDALDAARQTAQEQAQQRTEREQKLLAELDELREGEAAQRQRMDAANGATQGASAEDDSQQTNQSLAASQPAYEEKSQSLQIEGLLPSSESATAPHTTENARLNAEIKVLSKVTSEQIDRMEQAKARLAILEEL
ncbi:MAG TPA: hypothetical protein VMS31_10335, partial [Pyrinomonadaceae bacterium]|nr:hypothetical protein [Pyrinomonadaceae bacterium]